jgi:hypothetical protein
MVDLYPISTPEQYSWAEGKAGEKLDPASFEYFAEQRFNEPES